MILLTMIVDQSRSITLTLDYNLPLPVPGVKGKPFFMFSRQNFIFGIYNTEMQKNPLFFAQRFK